MCSDVDIWKTLYVSLVRIRLVYVVSVWKLRLLEARRDSSDLIQTYRLIKRLKQVYKHCIHVQFVLNAFKKNLMSSCRAFGWSLLFYMRLIWLFGFGRRVWGGLSSVKITTTTQSSLTRKHG